jgi:hypothetical protein
VEFINIDLAVIWVLGVSMIPLAGFIHLPVNAILIISVLLIAGHNLRTDLKKHQQGQTDYSTFCNDCAKSGIDKWVICMDKMTCTYYDKAGNEILIEDIPH